MKKIVLLFSLMFLMLGTMFGQQNYIRSSKIYLVEGTPTFIPNKYRGSVMALDTASNYKLYIYDYDAGSWASNLNVSTLTGGLSTIDLVADSINTRALVVTANANIADLVVTGDADVGDTLTVTASIETQDINVAKDLVVTELATFDSTATASEIFFLNGSLFGISTLLNTVDDTLGGTGIVFISTYTTTGAHEINLGTDATVNGRFIFIQDGDANAGTNNITLTGIQGVTINGQASYLINVNNESVILYALGTDWRILGSYLE